jgi:hypothetical protein
LPGKFSNVLWEQTRRLNPPVLLFIPVERRGK